MPRKRKAPDAAQRFTDPVSEYAYGVLDGFVCHLEERALWSGERTTYPAAKLVRLACERHLRDMASGAERGLVFDVDRAVRAIQFFGYLRQSKGEWSGQPLALGAWQRFIVGSIFGWMRAELDAKGEPTGRMVRRYRTVYEEIPRKNGKSTKAAGIGLKCFVADGEHGAECYTAATKKDQAKIVWDEAARMVKKSPALSKRVKVYKNNLNILNTASKFEPLGADEDTLDGLNLHCAIVDELHAHRKRAVVDVLETATGSRRQPLLFYITTAGYDRTSVCWEYHQYATQVLEGVVEDDSFFAYIATIDEEDLDNWYDPAVWAKANPNLGVSVKLDDLQRLAVRARQIPGMQNSFLRLRLNVWTQQSTRWLDTEVWNASAGDPFTLADMKGRPCYAGLDMSTTTDLTSVCYLFPPLEGESAYRAAWRFWLPESALDASKSKRGHRELELIRGWAREGFIRTTSGNRVDYDTVRKEILADLADLELRELAYDPWNATQLAGQFQDEGVPVVPVRQGFASLSEPSKLLASLLLEREFWHSGNPVAAWMASNVAIREDPAGNIKPDKGGSADRIDGIATAIIALARAMLERSAAGGWLLARVGGGQ